MRFIIQDWASNTLQHNNRFNRGCYGTEMGTPKVFKSFDDGWDWIFSNIKDEDEQSDLYIVEMSSVD